MCGRFTREYTWKDVHDFLDLRFPEGLDKPDSDVPALGQSWNVAPTQMSLVVRSDDGRIGLAESQIWGFSPSWMTKRDGAAPGTGPINARGETVATNGMFRESFGERRCVVPLSSFYEWQKIEGQKAKQPWRIHRADGAPILAAGIWTPSEGGGTFAIITTTPNDLVREIHDRMPVILEPEDASVWCDPGFDSEEATGFIKPAAEGVLDAHHVSTRVNSPKNNDAGLIVREDLGGGLFG